MSPWKKVVTKISYFDDFHGKLSSLKVKVNFQDMSKIRATIYIVKTTTRGLTASQFSFLKSGVIKGKLLVEIALGDTL